MKCKGAVLLFFSLLMVCMGAIGIVAAEESEPIIVKGDTNFRAVYDGFEVRLLNMADKYIFDPQWKDKERHLWEVTWSVRAVTDESKALFDKLHKGEVFYKGTGVKTVEFPFSYETITAPGKYEWLIVTQLTKFPKSFNKIVDANTVLGYSLGIPAASQYKAEDLRWNLHNVSPTTAQSKEMMGWKITYLGISRYHKVNETINAIARFKVERTTSQIKDAPKFDLLNIKNDLKREFQYHTSFIQPDEIQKGVYFYHYQFNVKEDDLASQRKWSFLLTGVELDQRQLVHFEFTLP